MAKLYVGIQKYVIRLNDPFYTTDPYDPTLPYDSPPEIGAGNFNIQSVINAHNCF